MAITVKKFKELVDDSNLEGIIKNVEYDIDNAIEHYAKLDSTTRETTYAVWMPEYWFYEDYLENSWYDGNYRPGRQHLGRVLASITPDARKKVRERVIDDYEDAGWNVDWDLSDVGEGNQAYVLTITLPDDECENCDDADATNEEPTVFD